MEETGPLSTPFNWKVPTILLCYLVSLPLKWAFWLFVRHQLRSRCSTARNASRHLRNAHGAARCASRPRRGAHPPTCCVHETSRRRAPSRQHSPKPSRSLGGEDTRQASHEADILLPRRFPRSAMDAWNAQFSPYADWHRGGRKPRVPNRNQLLALTGHILVRSKHAASGSCRTTQRTRLSPEKGLPNSAALKGTMVPTSGAVLGFNTAPFTHMLKKIFK